MKFFSSLLLLISFHAFSSIKEIKGYSFKENKVVLRKADVIIFLNKDCPCSGSNLEYLSSLTKEFPEFTFIGIHANKDVKQSEAEEFYKDMNLSFEILNDTNLEMANTFNALKTPHVFILDKKGEIIYNGGVTNKTSPARAKNFYLKDALIDIKNGNNPKLSETKTLGCYIAR